MDTNPKPLATGERPPHHPAGGPPERPARTPGGRKVARLASEAAARAGSSTAVTALAEYVDAVVSFERDAAALAAVIGCTFEDAAAELRKREAAGQSRQAIIRMAAEGWTPWGGWPPPPPSVDHVVAIGRRLQRFDWRRIWCALTDHVFDCCPGAPEPFCRRCGFSDYWPTRRTLGRLLDDVLGRFRRFRRRIGDDDIPF